MQDSLVLELLSIKIITVTEFSDRVFGSDVTGQLSIHVASPPQTQLQYWFTLSWQVLSLLLKTENKSTFAAISVGLIYRVAVRSSLTLHTKF